MREDMVNSIPDPPVWDRREFFVTSIFAAGAFGLAAQSTLAQTQIKTDSVGLTAGEVKISVADGEIPAGWQANGNPICTAAGTQSAVQIIDDGRGARFWPGPISGRAPETSTQRG